MRFHIATYGCQMNAGDSLWLSRTLSAMGWEEASEEAAQVFVVNTCSVRDKPEQKVYSHLGRLRDILAERPGGFVAVGGCVAQQIGSGFFGRFPCVRLVFGTDGLPSVPQALARIASEPRLRMNLTDFSEEYVERGPAAGADIPPLPAFVNIMQGCDNYCAYCIVPYVRGRQKSRSSRAILDECRGLAERGVRDVTLLGQNVNSYGQDDCGDGVSFAQLLFKVAALPGIERIRFTTSHPKDIAPEVVRAFGELENLCPSLHLPLQSGSDRILKLMGRSYDRARYLDIVDRLRAARPDIRLTTDIIVGFPTETEEDFLLTLDMLDRVAYESSFSFKYSDRPGVRAASMEPKVMDAVASERLARFQAHQDEFADAALERLVGSEALVLFEAASRKQTEGSEAWSGRDPAGRMVNAVCPAGANMIGKLARVLVTQAKKHSLKGEMAGEPW